MNVALLQEHLEKGFAGIHQLGYQSFTKELLPFIDSKPNELSALQLAEANYHIANVHIFHEAPLKAEPYYQKAIVLQPDYSEARLELAELYAQIGDYDKAFQMLQEIKKTNTTEAAELYQELQTLQNEYPEGIYVRGDLIWEMNEAIANEDFDTVIDTLEESTDGLELQVLSRAFGALADDEAYYSVWEEVIKQSDEIELDFADWFYMPRSVVESPDIWEIFETALGQLSEDSFFPIFDSLSTGYPGLSTAKLRKVMCEYNIARNTEDEKTLESLRRKFPKCTAFK